MLPSLSQQKDDMVLMKAFIASVYCDLIIVSVSNNIPYIQCDVKISVVYILALVSDKITNLHWHSNIISLGPGRYIKNRIQKTNSGKPQ